MIAAAGTQCQDQGKNKVHDTRPVLGIETSCDETGVAICGPTGILAETLHSQVALHAAHGGVVPEIAARDHVARLLPLIRQTLESAGMTPNDLGAVAYTAGPGLVGALMVGANLAAGLAYSLGRPTLPIHHMEAHLLAPQLDAPDLEFPFLALLVSGGHSLLVQASALGEYRVLGDTLDDAAGEAFDKVARLLGLPYPGGPPLSRLAESGDPNRFDFPRPMLRHKNLDFSFSGLKTAVSLAIEKLGTEPSEQDRADIAASFQAAAVETLVAKSAAAVAQTDVDTVIIAGGVGANRELRRRLDERAAVDGFSVYYPRPSLCTDNGAMIAYAGWCRRSEAEAEPGGTQARPRWSLEELAPPK